MKDNYLQHRETPLAEALLSLIIALTIMSWLLIIRATDEFVATSPVAQYIPLILVLIHYPVVDNLRFFAVAFVPPALLLRYYAHAKDYPTTLKAVITTFFVTVVLFMWAMLRYKFITF